MGGALSDLKSSLQGDDQLAANDALNSLETLAQTKMAEFYEKIESDIDARLMKVDKVVAKFFFIQGKASTDTTKLQDQIGQLVQDIAGGHWADAITHAAADIIGNLLGSSSASVEEDTSYMVSVNDIGGVERLDTYYFAYAFESQKLVSSFQNVVCSVVVKSSVLVDDIDDNTLRVLVNNSFPTLLPDIRIQLYEQLCLIIPKNPPSEAVQTATQNLEKILQANPPPSTTKSTKSILVSGGTSAPAIGLGDKATTSGTMPTSDLTPSGLTETATRDGSTAGDSGDKAK